MVRRVKSYTGGGGERGERSGQKGQKPDQVHPTRSSVARQNKTGSTLLLANTRDWRRWYAYSDMNTCSETKSIVPAPRSIRACTTLVWMAAGGAETPSGGGLRVRLGIWDLGVVKKTPPPPPTTQSQPARAGAAGAGPRSLGWLGATQASSKTPPTTKLSFSPGTPLPPCPPPPSPNLNWSPPSCCHPPPCPGWLLAAGGWPAVEHTRKKARRQGFSSVAENMARALPALCATPVLTPCPPAPTKVCLIPARLG